MSPATILEAPPAPATTPVVGARSAPAAPPVNAALASAFQAAGRPLWPLLANVSRTAVVAGGGVVVIHATDTGLVGLAVVAAGGLAVYGSIMLVAFRAGAWRRRTDAA